MWFLIFTTLIGLLIIIYVFGKLKEFIRRRNLLFKISGPKRHYILGNLLDYLCDEVTLFKRLRSWGQEYYPAAVYLLCAGLNYSVNVVGPDVYEAVASTTKNIEKGPMYEFLHLWLGQGLLTNTGAEWQTRRKILTPAFHFNILQQFLKIFVNETDHLVKVLKGVCHEPYVNIVPCISQFTLSAINETSMGTKLNLDDADDNTYCDATHQIGKLFTQRLLRPWFYFSKIYYNSSLGLKEKKLVNILHNYTNRVIKERSRKFEKFEISTIENENELSYSKRKKMAMLDLLLNAKFNDGIIDDKGIQDEVNTFMFEGHDTTSMAICFTLMMLANHQDVQASILQEINNVLGDSDGQPTYNELQELKIMERCIKECLRLYPSVPFISRVLEEDCKSSSGLILPKGAIVLIHIFDIHRNPKHWPNPEKFDPDRFLPENCVNRHPFAYVPFSAGPRNCIGQRFAILEMKVALCGILRNFRLEPVDTPENIVLITDIVLRTQNEILKVKFIPRE